MQIYRIYNSFLGIQLRAIITMAATCPIDKMDATANMIANHLKSIWKLCEFDDNSNNRSILFYRTYMTGAYLCTKCLFVANCFVQFILLASFLGTRNTGWGYNLLANWQSLSDDWRITGLFPRVTLCDFEVQILWTIYRVLFE